MSDQIIIRKKVEAHEVQQAPVKPTIIIGIGGSGGDILLRIRKRFFEKYGSLSHFPIVSYLWLDTDATEKNIGAGVFTEQIAFSPSEKLMTVMPDTTKITNDLNQYPHVKKWFYPGLTKLKTMTEGAGQIRAYSRLGFFEHYTEIKNAMVNAGTLVRNVENCRLVWEKHHLETNPNDLQVFIVTSVAGGTGSGMFLDVSFLVKDIFQGSALTTIGCVLMPGLFNPNEDRVFANSYAALKELEYYSYEHDFEVEWPDGVHKPIPGPPFNYTYLIDRTNFANNSVDFATRENIFNMISDNIFKDFTQGDFAGYKRGVRVNLDQYLVDLYAFHHLNENRESIIDQKFITRYSSFGMASITVPADRIEQACAYKLAADVVDHWGSLSKSEFNAAVLTDTVLRELLPSINMYEGSFNEQGGIVQRRDFHNFLLDDGRKQGQKIQNLIQQNIAQTSREIREGVYRQKGQGLAQYMRAAVEREQSKLQNTKPDPQQFGDYSRAVHFNKQELVENAEKLLHQEIGRIVNEQHQSVGYAIALLRQVVNILRDENREFIPAFQRGIAQEIKHAEESRRRLDHLLAEVARHDNRRNWDGRKRTIIDYDVLRFEELAPEYLRSVLLTQVRGAAVEAYESLIAYIGMAERTDGGELYSEGLIGELYTLGGQLDNLKRRLQNKYEHFKEPTKSELSLLLYDPADIEGNYLPRYLGTGDRAAKQIESIGDQILQELQTSVINLPQVVRLQGIDKVELQIRDLCRKPFAAIRKDFDVLETLWKKYPNENEREAQIRFIFNRAKFWLRGGSRPRSYQLTPERHKILVGVPQQSTDPIKLEEFKLMLRTRITGPGDPALSVQAVPDRSEIVFYSEVGGIPLNWSDSIPEMRQKYLAKQAEGEELHTDCNEIKFEDLLVLDDRERAELEEAHECFLLGLIFQEIEPEKDYSGRVRYLWSEKVGLGGPIKKIALGIEMRALAELISKKVTREKLLKRIYDKLEKVKNIKQEESLELLACFNALLGWYFEKVYPEKKIKGSDDVERYEQSNMCRAVAKQIDAIEKLIGRAEQEHKGISESFGQSTSKYREQIDKQDQVNNNSRGQDNEEKNFFAPLLSDGKRGLRLKLATAAAGVANDQHNGINPSI